MTISLNGAAKVARQLQHKAAEAGIGQLVKRMTDVELRFVSNWDGNKPLPTWFDSSRAGELKRLVRNLE